MRTAAFVAATIALLALACGGAPSYDAAPAPQTSSATSPALAAPVTTVLPTATSRSAAALTPAPGVTLPPLAQTVTQQLTQAATAVANAEPFAGVRASIIASCRTSGGSTTITVNYNLDVSGAGQLTRVRLLDGGQVVDDSGPISQSSVRRQASLTVSPGSSHSFEVSYDPPANTLASARSNVSC